MLLETFFCRKVYSSEKKKKPNPPHPQYQLTGLHGQPLIKGYCWFVNMSHWCQFGGARGHLCQCLGRETPPPPTFLTVGTQWLNWLDQKCPLPPFSLPVVSGLKSFLTDVLLCIYHYQKWNCIRALTFKSKGFRINGNRPVDFYTNIDLYKSIYGVTTLYANISITKLLSCW